MTKFYVSKWALNDGVLEVDGFVEANDPFANKMLVATRTAADGTVSQHHFFGEGNEWHRTRRAALDRAHIMRRSRIDSLEKQITKLKRMEIK